jgi:predicted AlkP superfamily pyrophosphatase or phosphodiesterase
MKKIISFSCLLLFFISGYTQPVQRPKLVVGIVVDQMRWDYLYRYYERYLPDGGFKRLLNKGFSCENTIIPFAPTVTGTGHSTIFSGSVPAISGIIGNNWWDKQLNRSMYCTEDKAVKTVGSNTSAGEMSPRNLLVTTIADEMRLATNFRSKVIGIAQKDRGSILCAGHSANAAYWYDPGTGDWISSTWYMSDLPKWVKDFNAQQLVDKYYQEGWKTLYPVDSYLQSTADEKNYEGSPFGKKFPYDLKKFARSDYGILNTTPFGNTFTFEMAKAAVIHEQLGTDANTDMLAISLSSPDYIGHTFGPNSVEVEDCFLRLDAELGRFMDFLDATIGKNQYLLFLSSDHGVAHVPGFLQENKIPGGYVRFSGMAREMNEKLNEKYGKKPLIAGIYNAQVYLNDELISMSGLNREEITKWVIDFMVRQPGVDRAFELAELMETPLPEKTRNMYANGYHPARSGDIQVVLVPQWMDRSGNTGTTHGSWYPYDALIPLLWYGWGIKPGKLYREVTMSDIAPTIAALLHIQPPSGSVGRVIEEIIK